MDALRSGPESRVSFVASAWRQRLGGRDDPYGAQGQSVSTVSRWAKSTTFRTVLSRIGTPPPASVLEAGIGSGKFSLAFGWMGYHVTALDCVHEVLAGARQTAVSFGLMADRVRFVCGDLDQPPLQASTFDVVFNEGVIEHWLGPKERSRLIATMVKLVRPGGTLCVIVPNGAHPWHERWVANHYPGYESAPPMTLYDGNSLRDDLAASGLGVVTVDGLGAWQSLNLWPHYPLVRRPLAGLDRFLPGPRGFRFRYAMALIGCGQRPKGGDKVTESH